VDRAWAYSFYTSGAGPQVQGFYDVLARILSGDRIGLAVDHFNFHWAALSTDLVELLNRRLRGEQVDDAEVANSCVARDDARNYVILGDPAVRLRVEDMQ